MVPGQNTETVSPEVCAGRNDTPARQGPADFSKSPDDAPAMEPPSLPFQSTVGTAESDGKQPRAGLDQSAATADTSPTIPDALPLASASEASAEAVDDLPVVLLADSKRKLNWWERAALVLVGLSIFGVLATARWLNPYNPDGQPRRWGTHEQLGLPPCTFQRLTGWPCPSCGLTTSFSLLMHGDWRPALAANPIGPILALTAAVLAVWFSLAGISGHSLGLPSWHSVSTIATWSILFLVLGCWLLRLAIFLSRGNW